MQQPTPSQPSLCWANWSTQLLGERQQHAHCHKRYGWLGVWLRIDTSSKWLVWTFRNCPSNWMCWIVNYMKHTPDNPWWGKHSQIQPVFFFSEGLPNRCTTFSSGCLQVEKVRCCTRSGENAIEAVWPLACFLPRSSQFWPNPANSIRNPANPKLSAVQHCRSGEMQQELSGISHWPVSILNISMLSKLSFEVQRCTLRESLT